MQASGIGYASRQAMSAREVRRIILDVSKRANVGHIGSCLCVVEILIALYERVLRVSTPGERDRDRFILSKGHAGLALYAVLVLKGWIPRDALLTFCGGDSRFGVHPEAVVPGIDFSTGSLGQGLSMATGAALAARLQGSARKVFCLISDAECNEGAIWEAAMFAAQHRLGNLTTIIDCNGQQALGITKEVLDLSDMRRRWEAFGWRVTETDGHAIPALTAAMTAPAAWNDAPHVIVAKTTFGKGVSYMEQGVPVTQKHLPIQAINWHYLPMSDVEYEMAIRELECGV